MQAWLSMLALVVSSTAVEHVNVLVGDGIHLEDATVVWDRGVIVSVGRGPAPAGAERVDGSHKVLTPGLIETRSHLGLSEIDEEETTNDHVSSTAAATPAFRAADGFNPTSLRIPVARAEGITGAVASPAGQVLYGAAAWVDTSGLGLPDATRPVALFGGVGHAAAAATGGARGGVWLLLRQIWEDARFYQKNRAAFDKGDARRLVLDPVQLAAVLPVLDGKIPLVLHAERAADILRALEMAREQKLRIIINGGAEAWRVAPELAAAKVPVLLRPSNQEPSSFETLGAREDAAAVLHQAGVPVVLSSGGVNQDIPRLRHEAGMAVAFGLPHDAALTAITLEPARTFGKDGELGSVSPGKRADLVLWSGDPFETQTVAERVWIAGVAQTAKTRQQRLAERYMHGR